MSDDVGGGGPGGARHTRRRSGTYARVPAPDVSATQAERRASLAPGRRLGAAVAQARGDRRGAEWLAGGIPCRVRHP